MLIILLGIITRTTLPKKVETANGERDMPN